MGWRERYYALKFKYTYSEPIESDLDSSSANIFGTQIGFFRCKLDYDCARHIVWLLGALGTLLCVAGGLGVWYAESRIDRARKQVFDRIDQAFSGINSRLIETQNLAAKSKITVEEIQQRMQDWTKKEASDRLAARFDVEARVQQLAAGLRQAELMLELSHETVQNVRQALEVGIELGFSLNADSVDPLFERIADIKEDLIHAIDTADSLGERVGDDGDDESLDRRAEQAATIAARLLATFGIVDSRLAAFRGRLTNAQDAISQLNAKTHARVVAVAVCATLFLLWMAAGQLCLWRWARNR